MRQTGPAPRAGLRRPAEFGRHLVLVGAALAFAGLIQVVAAGPAAADNIPHPTAIFAGLDKITGRIISFEVAINETVQFGSLHITPRVCYTRPQTEAPQTTGFVEVEEVVAEKKFKKIFTGWMYAASPGLHGVEHPVYDAWLTDCKGGKDVIRTAKPKEDEEELPSRSQPEKQAEKPTRRRDTRRASRPDRDDQRRAPSRSFFPQNPGQRPGLNPFGNY